MAGARIEEHDLGLTWVMDEPMGRACHAIADAGRVWLIDPVDDEEALGSAASLGQPQAVLQLLDRHNRDCAEIASRLSVPLLIVPDAVPDSPFETIGVIRNPLWKEAALWWPGRAALVVAEMIGTAPLFSAGGGAAGVHPMLRAWPPGALRGKRPRHLLVGHGPALHGPEAEDAVERSYERSRADIPSVLRMLPKLGRG